MGCPRRISVSTSPFILFQIWAFVSPAISPILRVRVKYWFVSAFFLFLAGVIFSYFIAIPTALKFLIDFGKGIALPNISVGKYISFFGALILAGGIVFLIPVVMAFLVDSRLIKTSVMKKKRHIAFLGIMVLSAVITPTQDITNMLIFAAPMLVLYEAGLIIGHYLENKNDKLKP